MSECRQRVSRRQVAQRYPSALGNAADDLSEPLHYVGIPDLMKDPVVDQAEHFVGQMTWQLCDEHQTEMALPAAPGDPHDLLEQVRHLLDAAV